MPKEYITTFLYSTQMEVLIQTSSLSVYLTTIELLRTKNNSESVEVKQLSSRTMFFDSEMEIP